ncbi:hypothetical protein Rhopal_005759-T1 [Rhodotorula paludigena]|uniref:Cyclin-domain-containing protein n=1 Tax=Rhodotorula paludigena TaxID=86838 RepID=A0AAV5GVW1_9BASI|nr:hypothetical protein Rhopal_005759-T1 [Rhodotorula paludigena]
MLDRLIEHNDRIPLTSTSLTRFHSRAPPNISVRDYLLRIAKFTNVEACCLLILLPYVDKVCARLSSFTISSLTVHRFLIAAVSVGSKALSDAFCTNGRYARVGGVSVVEMNLLEKEFCEALDWRLTTSGPVLAHYYTSLVRSHPGYRLSDAPLPSPPPPPHIDIPAPTSPLAPQSPLTPSGQPHSLFGAMAMDVEQPPSAAPAALAPVSTNGPVDRPSPSSPPSPTAPPSSSSSNVSLSSNSAFSASNPHSLSGSPQRDRHRGRERADPTSDQSGSGGFSPSLAVGPSPFAPPPLIPPKLHSASASHLPSPIRAPGMGSAGAARRSSVTSPPLARVAAAAEVPPASPAKRARGPSTSGQGGQAGPGAATANGSYRFAPSPRLSNGADTAAGSAAAVAAAMDEGY